MMKIEDKQEAFWLGVSTGVLALLVLFLVNPLRSIELMAVIALFFGHLYVFKKGVLET